MLILAQGHTYRKALFQQPGAHQAADFPVADDQHIVGSIRSVFQDLQRFGGNRCFRAGEAQGGFDLFGGGDGGAEKHFQQRVGAMLLPGQGDGIFHLGDDLILSPDLGESAAAQKAQMVKALFAPAHFVKALTVFKRQIGRLAEQGKGIGGEAFPAGKVDLGAVAGGKQNCPFHHLHVEQGLEDLLLAAFGQGKPLADVDTGHGMVDAGHGNIQKNTSPVSSEDKRQKKSPGGKQAGADLPQGDQTAYFPYPRKK